MKRILTLSARDAWIDPALRALESDGCLVVTDVLDVRFLERARSAIQNAREGILRDVGSERLQRAGELGTLRLPFKYDPFFFEFLAIREVLNVVDSTVGRTAILHLQNAFALPPMPVGRTPVTPQNSFHRDFPRYMNGYLASINTFLAIDAFTGENGATLVVPGTQQTFEAPPEEDLGRSAVPVLAPAGSMIVFDSTLWHAAGHNVSGVDRLAVNMQFTRSFIKQQIDYVRALGPDTVLALPPRTQQLLGWYTRVVTSLDEYYQPDELRLYRRGQG